MDIFYVYHIQNFLGSLVIVLTLFIYNSANIYNAILSLVIIFLFYFCFLIYLGLDFIAQAFIIIYAGAIVILFILVMMVFEAPNLGDKLFNYRKTTFYSFGSMSFLALLLTLLFVIALSLNSYFLALQDSSKFLDLTLINHPVISYFENSNIYNIGNQLFTYYALDLFLFGLLLIIIILGIFLIFL